MGKFGFRFLSVFVFVVLALISLIEDVAASSCGRLLRAGIVVTSISLGSLKLQPIRIDSLKLGFSELSPSSLKNDSMTAISFETAEGFLKRARSLARSNATGANFQSIFFSLSEAIKIDKFNPKVWGEVGDILYYLSIRHPARTRPLSKEAIRAYRNAYELSKSEEAAAPFRVKMVFVEEQEGNDLFLTEFFSMVKSESRVLVSPSGDVIEVPDFSKLMGFLVEESFAPVSHTERIQHYISNRISQTRVVLKMISEYDESQLRQLLGLHQDSEPPSESILRVLPYLESHLLSGIRALARIGDVENSIQDLADLWELSFLLPTNATRVYSATLVVGTAKIASSFYSPEFWVLMRAFRDDSSKLRWSDLLGLSLLAKTLMQGQHSPFEQQDLIEMRKKWAAEGIRKLKAVRDPVVPISTSEMLQDLFLDGLVDLGSEGE